MMRKFNVLFFQADSAALSIYSQDSIEEMIFTLQEARYFDEPIEEFSFWSEQEESFIDNLIDFFPNILILG